MEKINMFFIARAGIVFAVLVLGTALYMKRGLVSSVLFLCGAFVCDFVEGMYEKSLPAADAVRGCLLDTVLLFVLSIVFVFLLHAAAGIDGVIPSSGVFGYLDRAGAGVSDILAFFVAAEIFSKFFYGMSVIMLFIVCVCNARYLGRSGRLKTPEMYEERSAPVTDKGHGVSGAGEKRSAEKVRFSFAEALSGHADMFIPSVLSVYCASCAVYLAVLAVRLGVFAIR